MRSCARVAVPVVLSALALGTTAPPAIARTATKHAAKSVPTRVAKPVPQRVRPAAARPTGPVVTTTLPRRLPLSDPEAWSPGTFQAVVDGWLATKPSVGTVAVAVAGPGRLWTGGATRGTGAAAFGPGDRYGVLSITKTITSALVLRAVDAGLLSLDAPLPDVAGVDRPAGPITLRHLLTHTSGLIDYPASPNYRAGASLTPVDAVNLSTDFPLVSQPGTLVSYANTNYLYLQVLLESVTGKWYATLVSELAAELGLAETTVEPPDHNGWYGGASGGVRSTVGDLARWGAALFTPGRVLSPPMLAQFLTLDPHDVGMGTWPICPCSTDGQGARHYTALGHHTVAGALEFYPATGLVVAVRIGPVGGEAGGFAAELGLRLSGVFAAR